MFGFSRGAFTVRTLAGMIQRQGLMPRVINGRTVTVAEMDRNSRGAWHAYREATAPLFEPESKWPKMAPYVAAIRWLRDRWIVLWRRLLRQDLHQTVLQQREAALQPRPPEGLAEAGVGIEFLGLFDTVEAYGLPMEELRDMWDFWISPIRFRNRRVSSVVRTVRHAMALDEERLTFAPLNCERASGPAGVAQNMAEVWFPGCHSDLGGGYDDDRPSFQALGWMAEEAIANGLILRQDALVPALSQRTSMAAIHDSRLGLGAFFRYQPRRVTVDPSVCSVPVVHPVMPQMIIEGCNGYAPVMLQKGYKVLGGLPPLAPAQQDVVAALVRARVLADRLCMVLLMGLAAVLANVTWLGRPSPDTIRRLALALLVSLASGAALISVSLRDRIKDEARERWRPGGHVRDGLTKAALRLDQELMHRQVLTRLRAVWRRVILLFPLLPMCWIMLDLLGRL